MELFGLSYKLTNSNNVNQYFVSKLQEYGSKSSFTACNLMWPSLTVSHLLLHVVFHVLGRWEPIFQSYIVINTDD